MLPSLLVAAAVTAPAAPIPRDTDPNTSGPAPRVVAVKADGSGIVWITAQVYEKRKVPQQFFVVENGKQVLKQQEVEQMVSNYIRKSIADFGGKFTTADGTALTAEEATKRVKEGATLLVTADGKPISKGWLRAVGDDTVVMTAEGLAQAHFQYGAAPMPMTAAPRMAKFCADETGAVKVAINPNGDSFNGGQIYYDDFGGGRAIRGRVVINGGDWEGGYYPPQPTATGPDNKKLLADVKFDAYDTSGKLVPRAEALKRLKAGGLVLLAGDNRFPDAEYLKAFRDDVLVLVSGEFVFPQGTPNPYDMPPKPTAPAKADNQAVPVLGVPLPAAPVNAVQLKLVKQAVVAAEAEERAERAERAAKEAAAKAAAEKAAAVKAAAEKAGKPAAKPVVPVKP